MRYCSVSKGSSSALQSVMVRRRALDPPSLSLCSTDRSTSFAACSAMSCRRAGRGLSTSARSGPGTGVRERFARFGQRSAICFPVGALFGESSIELGDGCIIGPNMTLSAGVSPEQVLNGPVVTIGDRCVIGKGSGVVGHQRIEIGDDVWTGHYVYVTDANHGYADPVEPVGHQFAAPRPVRIGSGSWLGHGALVLGGANIGAPRRGRRRRGRDRRPARLLGRGRQPGAGHPPLCGRRGLGARRRHGRRRRAPSCSSLSRRGRRRVVGCASSGGSCSKIVTDDAVSNSPPWPFAGNLPRV